MTVVNRPLAAYLLLGLLGLGAIFWRLGKAPVYRSMEGRECLVIQEIVRSNEWILPLRNGEDVPHKPPMMHWVGALIGNLRGGLVDESTVRLPSALASFLSLFLLFELVKREHGPRGGLLSSLILLTSESFTRQAREAWVDATLSFWVLAALFSFRQLSRDKQWEGWRQCLFFACIGFAVLSKGPVGALIPLMAAAAFLCTTGQARALPKLLRPPGIAVAAAIAIAWYGPALAEGGELFFTTQLVKENIMHFLHGQEGSRPFSFYLPGLLVEAAPWSVLLPAAAWQAWKNRKQRSLQTLSLWWLITSLVFFSIAAGKRHVYLLPTMPAVAILVSNWLDELRLPLATREKGLWLIGFSTFLGLLVLGAWTSGALLNWWPGVGLLEMLGAQAWRTILDPLTDALPRHPYLMTASTVGLSAAGGLVAAALRSGRPRLLVGAFVCFFSFYTLLPQTILRERFKWRRTLKNFALSSASVANQAGLYYFRTGEISQAFFYLDRHVPQAPCKGALESMAGCPAGYYFVDTELWERMPAPERARARVILRSAGMDGPVKREDLVLVQVTP